MTLVGWLWLGSPFAVIGLVSHHPRLLKLVSAHVVRCQVLGWAGVAMMFLGVIAVSGLPGSLMFWLGTPLAGLAVWLGGDDGDDGGDDGPDVPPFDWDDFERSFWAHVRGRGRARRPPHVPTAG